ncbi:hypothetical protein ZWY2020_004623 [Hordeum vulgare]|nr:hypothetical protein ZWY2020_004623 [Hordeum vulgare]
MPLVLEPQDNCLGDPVDAAANGFAIGDLEGRLKDAAEAAAHAPYNGCPSGFAVMSRRRDRRRRLKALPWQLSTSFVVPYSRLTSTAIASASFVSPLYGFNTTVVGLGVLHMLHLKGDRKDFDSVKTSLSAKGFNIVYDINGREATEVSPILEALPNLEQFIYCSSAGVYLKSDLLPHFETDDVDPKSRHKGKLETESLLEASDVNWTKTEASLIWLPRSFISAGSLVSSCPGNLSRRDTRSHCSPEERHP